jgi:hypothetical protein
VAPTSVETRLANILAEVKSRGGTPLGDEFRYRCSQSDRHEHGDAHPSARWNPVKKAFFCDVCGEGGGWTKLERLFGLVPETRQVRRATERQEAVSLARKPTTPDVAIYQYRDLAGTVRFEVVRKRDKSFSQRRPDPEKPGAWKWDLDGVERVPYKLPELLAARPSETVYIVEGEKDADAIAARKGVATTNPGGAGKWIEPFSLYLTERSVVVLSDNDEPGRRHVERVANSISSVAASVKVIGTFPGLEERTGADVSDWFAAGHDLDDLYALADRTPVWVSGNQPSRSSSRFVTADELLAEPEEEVEWQVDRLLPAGGTSLLVAKPKAGKSTLGITLSQCTISGSSFLGRAVAKGPVIYLAYEGARRQWRGRIRRAGLSGSDFHFFHGSAEGDPLADAHAMAVEIGARLIVVDTLWHALRAQDGNAYGDVLLKMEQFIHVANETGAHVVLLHHAKKGEGGLDEDAALGSTALFASVDTQIVLRKVSKEGEEVIFYVSSINRDGDELPKSVLVQDPITDLLSISSTKAEADLDRAKTVLLEQLAEDPGSGKTDQDLKAADLGLRRALMVKARSSLFEAGEIDHSGTGKRGDPKRWHKTNPPGPVPIEVSGSQVPTVVREPGIQKRTPTDATNEIDPKTSSGDPPDHGIDENDSGNRKPDTAEVL